MRNFLSLLTILSLLLSPIITLASSEFNPNFIISDEELQDTTCWTKNDIQSFLQSQNSYLSTYTAPGIDGYIKSASEIIYDAAVANKINPKFLVVTLQKEQSLITDKTPNAKQLDWATGYAVCDSCDTKEPSVAKHAGFAKQVDNAAGLMRWYYNNSNQSFVKQKNQQYVIDNQTITPQNWATAFLYTYTPHIHGNQNFWKIWKEWFDAHYPNGTLLKSVSSTDVWLVQNNIKRKFSNQSVLISRADPKMIITVPESELSNYQTGKNISFPNYSILKTSSKTYLLDYDTLRPFASDEVVRQIGYNPQEIITVSDNDISDIAIGPTILLEEKTPPQGIIYQITDSKDSYLLLKDNILYPILDKNIIKANYSNLKLEKVSSTQLAKYKMADTIIAFQDGNLIGDDAGNIYAIENGKKRKFASEEAFTSLGYKKENIIKVPQNVAFAILNGEAIYSNIGLDLSKLNTQVAQFLGDQITNVKDLFGSKLPAYLVAEYPAGKIIAGKNIDSKRSIASLTKALIGYEALEQGLDLKKIIAYDAKKYDSDGYSLNLNNGIKLTGKDMLNTMLIGSYNNIARMAAQSTGLTEKQMVEKINERLKTWSASNTYISDVTGLSEKNISTARDLLKIFTNITKKFEIANILGKTRHDFASADGINKFSIKNTNTLNHDNSNYKILASKTGYTDEAGSVLYILIQSKKDNKKYSIITLGETNYANRLAEPDKIAKWISASPNLTIAGIK